MACPLIRSAESSCTVFLIYSCHVSLLYQSHAQRKRQQWPLIRSAETNSGNFDLSQPFWDVASSTVLQCWSFFSQKNVYPNFIVSHHTGPNEKSPYFQEQGRARAAVCHQPSWSLPPHQLALATSQGSTCCKVHQLLIVWLSPTVCFQIPSYFILTNMLLPLLRSAPAARCSSSLSLQSYLNFF